MDMKKNKNVTKKNIGELVKGLIINGKKQKINLQILVLIT